MYDKEKKRILLVIPKFFNYEKNIKKHFELMGYDVDLIIDETPFRTILCNYIPYMKLFFGFYVENKIKKLITKNDYTSCLVIKGSSLSLKALTIIESHIKNRYLYQWDSLSNYPYQTMLLYFNHVLTFDISDSKHLNLEYYPLFSMIENDRKELSRNIDILFIGSFHSDRYKVLKEILCQYKDLNIYFYLYIPFLSYIKRIFKGEKILLSDIRFFKIKPEKLSCFYNNSKCVLDIEAYHQTGFTMRTLEALYCGCKLITTNDNIYTADFFDKKIISVIDRNDVLLDKSFIFNDENVEDNKILQVKNLKEWVVRFADD